MIFGRPEVFAIEVHNERTAESPSGLWGRSCVHVQGNPIGAILEPHCGLDAFADHIAEVLSRLDSLCDGQLGMMDDTEVFSFLDQRLYGDAGRTVEQMSADWTSLGRFCFLTNVGDQFDGWKAFMFLRPDGMLRITSCRGEGPSIVHRIDRPTFEIVASTFLEWIEAERERVASL
ncbi:MAG TPA: hypothetical protein VK178_18420 [Opitutaceae bacterium]|nr:hypothetical protein [Opitutaceae bacterium]